ncbi:hypothetical protein CDL15_Pgr026868 [Punica granatum]|uniref:Uncharacterized protein n=1 Tax=Punica granatum TaxID=22663 RepID=A0A218WLQ6_PUNGR|nr:hypothetical protein CDL15_Pgr026868 [Punica granatum]
MNAPTCIHVPRQISRGDLVKLLLETWVTNFERLHQNAQPIQSSKPKFGKRPDGKVVISFDHRSVENSELSAPPMFQTMMMMQPVEGVQDNLKEAQKKADPKPNPNSGADESLSTVLKKKKVLPCYKPILKWVRKQKWEDPEEIRDYLKDMVLASIFERLVHKMEQKGKLAAIPQAAPTYMFCPSLPSYDEQFPQLGQFTDGEGRHTHAFKIPNPTSKDEQGRPRFFTSGEAVLNWQFSQNRVLSSVGTKVDSLMARVSQLDGKVDRHHLETQSLLRTLQKRLKEIQDTPVVSYFQIDLDRKEEEIRKLKNQIVILSGTPAPLPPTSSTTSLFNFLERPLGERSKLARLSLFSHSQDEQQPKKATLVEIREREKQATEVARRRYGIKKEVYETPPRLVPSTSKPPKEEKEKKNGSDEEEEDLQGAFMVFPKENSLSSFLKEQCEESHMVVKEETSDSVSEEESEASPEESEDSWETEDSYPPVKMMGMRDGVDSDDAMSEMADPPQAAAPTTPTRGNIAFTLDDIPYSKWPDRLQEFLAYLTTRALTVRANHELMSDFVSRFTKTLRIWWTGLTDQDQVQFIVSSPTEAVHILHVYFVGYSGDLRELKRKEFFERKCCSYKRKHLDLHFKHMVRLFYEFGADISLKQVFLSSIPATLAGAAERLLHDRGKRVIDCTVGEIQQEIHVALEDACLKKQVIKEVLKGDKSMEKACKRPELYIKMFREVGLFRGHSAPRGYDLIDVIFAIYECLVLPPSIFERATNRDPNFANSTPNHMGPTLAALADFKTVWGPQFSLSSRLKLP